jgi:integrase/recombinase XerD
MNKRPEYCFNHGIQNRLEGFRTYLQELGNGEATIGQKSNYTGYFLQWLENERLPAQDVRYNDLLGFIDYCKSEGNSSKLTNGKLRGVRNYYEFLKKYHPAIINPACGLHLRGTRRRAVNRLTSFKELENLYRSYPERTPREKRNRIILGLLVYQGVTTEELQQLETGHIRLKDGKIDVPGNRRRNSRTLELEPFQISELHRYLTRTRPQILAEITKSKPARKPGTIDLAGLEGQLFISINGSRNIKNSLLHLFRDVQKINPKIANARQIRSGAITCWLKNHNLRQVQYMAGHKYVSSTEPYQAGNLENLQIRLEKCHPLSK